LVLSPGLDLKPFLFAAFHNAIHLRGNNFSQPYLNDQNGIGRYQLAQPLVTIGQVRANANLTVPPGLMP